MNSTARCPGSLPSLEVRRAPVCSLWLGQPAPGEDKTSFPAEGGHHRASRAPKRTCALPLCLRALLATTAGKELKVTRLNYLKTLS